MTQRPTAPPAQHDVIIVGGGAAALSAALVLSRAQARVLVIDGGKPRNAPAEHMHGFISRDGMPPADFLATARREVTSYGGVIHPANVTSITGTGPGGPFTVTLDDGGAATGRAVLIATGLTDVLPEIPGVRERWGGSVHHCPYCHGFEVSGMNVAVIGSANVAFSVKQAGLLRRYSDQITFVTNGIPLDKAQRDGLAAFDIAVIDGVVDHIIGPSDPGASTGVGTDVDGLALVDGTIVACEAAFVAPRPRPNDALLLSLGCDVDLTTGLVTVTATGDTTVTGVWAAGNVVTPSAQVITAAGAGSAAALAISGWLLEQDLAAALAARP